MYISPEDPHPMGLEGIQFIWNKHYEVTIFYKTLPYLLQDEPLIWDVL